jgi:hypothetical protein
MFRDPSGSARRPAGPPARCVPGPVGTGNSQSVGSSVENPPHHVHDIARPSGVHPLSPAPGIVGCHSSTTRTAGAHRESLACRGAAGRCPHNPQLRRRWTRSLITRLTKTTTQQRWTVGTTGRGTVRHRPDGALYGRYPTSAQDRPGVRTSCRSWREAR